MLTSQSSLSLGTTESAAAHPVGLRAVRQQKLLGLELMRFMAAFAVLFWHYQHLWWTPVGLTGFVRTAQPLYRLFSIFYDFGLYGVQVFWAISGYIFFWKYRRSVAERCIGYRTFFVLRFSRLYPLHFATLLLVAALQIVYVSLRGYSFVYGNNDLFHFALQLLFASNWGFQSGASFNGPIWSISVEILAYITFFAVLRYLGSSLLSSIAIIIAATAGYTWGGHSPIFQCFVCFYVGGLSATLAASPWAQAHRRLLFQFAVACLIIVPVIAVAIHVERFKFLAQAATIAYLPVLLYVMAEHCRIPGRLTKAVVGAGNLTYSSYLIHFPLQLTIAIVCAVLDVAIPAENPVFFVCYMGTIWLLAWLILEFYEMPCQRLVRRRLAPADPTS